MSEMESMESAERLEDLDLDISALTPTERWVLSDVLEGLKEGYAFGSKREHSFS